jgi:hypothetical protein
VSLLAYVVQKKNRLRCTTAYLMKKCRTTKAKSVLPVAFKSDFYFFSSLVQHGAASD